MRKRILFGLTIAALVLTAGIIVWAHQVEAPASPRITAAKQMPAATPPAKNFDKTQYSLSDPTSLWVIANKQHPLQPLTYTPSDLRYPAVLLQSPGQPQMQLRDAAATALEQLFVGASQAGYQLEMTSGYRSYDYQKTLYAGYVASAGQDAADQESARPGYSEHQTGLAVDISTHGNHCTLEACFGDLPEGKWLAEFAYNYGFLLRYPADKVPVTGYEYEPWHFRYVGIPLAQELHKQNITTLEEFFGVSGGTTYK